MIKAKELIGRTIVALSNGEEVDKVAVILFDHDGNQVLVLLTDKGAGSVTRRLSSLRRYAHLGRTPSWWMFYLIGIL